MHITVSFAISFIYMHSCERKKSLLLTVGYAKCIKKSMKNDLKGRARTKTKQKTTKIKSKGAFKKTMMLN